MGDINKAQKACCMCRFAGEREGGGTRPCKRKAPIAVHDPQKYVGIASEAFVPRWPMVMDSDWCGDFDLSDMARMKEAA